MDKVEHLKIPLEVLKSTTNNFSDQNIIGRGGFGNVYRGELTVSGQLKTVAVKRLDTKYGQGNREFMKEIQMLSCCRHKNLVLLIGFCDESEEKILVYEYVKYGSLDNYIKDEKLSWIQRLKISLGAARGLSYLHNDVGPQHRVLHMDIKSPNILLDENWEAKISDFGLSKMGPSNVEFTFLVTLACGSLGYIDPQYIKTNILTKESDVYSFGVVLFELLCGRFAVLKDQGESRSLSLLAQRSCEQNRLHEIIFPSIKNEMRLASLNIFSMVAYQCLKKNRTERPTMAWIVEKLEEALELQLNSKVAVYVRVGTWGKQSQGPENSWSFELEQGQKLQKITIDHDDDAIYSLTFTTEARGLVHTSNKVGGSGTGQTVSEVMFKFDEEIIGISGSIGTRGGDTLIRSLSFKTNTRTHGPFGQETTSVFSIPLEKGSLVGFYGLAGNYVDGIGVYVKAYDDIKKIGTWGRTDPGGPQNKWSFQLERTHHLKKITIDHGDLIYSLIFTTQYKESTSTSGKVGGWNGGDKVSEVTFDGDEEINAISGTVALSRGTYAGYTVISSIAFVTNKRIYGPFGNVRGEAFTVPWDHGSFAGFYGLCGYFLDSIGVYLKARK